MLVASDSEGGLSVFPLLNPASKHDSHGSLHTFFRMGGFLSKYKARKLLLDSTHVAMPHYKYCRSAGIVPSIGLNGKGGVKLPYKNNLILPLVAPGFLCAGKGGA